LLDSVVLEEKGDTMDWCLVPTLVVKADAFDKELRSKHVAIAEKRMLIDLLGVNYLL